jgi:hypothetical protein
MITTTESSHKAEYKAAQKLHQRILEACPSIEHSGKTNVKLIPNVQCYGQNPQDIDLVMMYFNEGNGLTGAEAVFDEGFCATIEIKGHSSSAVKFQGGSVHVLYNGKWHEVSSQSESQKYSLKNFLEARSIGGRNIPRIINILWLTDVPTSELPPEPHNIIGSDVTWDIIKKKAEQLVSGASRKHGSFHDKMSFNKTAEALDQRLAPTRIDRKRIERITQHKIQDQKYYDKLGEQLLTFSGRGGTGKTARLLFIAHHLYNTQGARVLILTYNNALVADLRRLLSLMQIPDCVAEGSVSVQTIYSFFSRWLSGMQILSKDDDYNDPRPYMATFTKYIDEGVVTQDDINQVRAVRSRYLAWDYVLIDEAQDCLSEERDLLFRLYGHKKCVVSDGMDQMIRSGQSIDWRESIPTGEQQKVSLRRSLRMKSSLCKFVMTFADDLGFIDYGLEPQDDVHGGKIIVLFGTYYTKDLHDALVKQNKQDGNDNIDILFCVPPNFVKKYENKNSSVIAKKLQDWSYGSWDGVSELTRRTFPTNADECRIVQYDSCRGLEGWVVVNLALDQFYDYKKSTFDKERFQDQLVSFEDAMQDYLRRWLMIPMTRAVDTLVIHISNKEHPVAGILKNIHTSYPGLVDWRE